MSRTATWHAPDGQVHNQIDFILSPQRFKSSINKVNTRSFPGADTGSSHVLVLTTTNLKLKTKRFTKSLRIRFDLEKLKDPKIAEMFQAKVGGTSAIVCVLDSDMDTLVNSLRGVLLSTAEKVCGRQRKKIQPWVTNVRPETAAETTEIQNHRGRTRVQNSEQRSQEEDEGSKGTVD